MTRSKYKTVLIVLRRAFQLLRKTDPLILCSSTAFFATFSLSPIIIILVNLFGLYFKSGRVSNQLFKSIGATFGRETAREVQGIVHNFMAIESNWLITIGGSIFFLFVATTLLSVIKQAIHKLWRIRRKPKMHFKFYGLERGTELGIILFSGILFLISLFMDTMLTFSLDYLQSVWPAVAVYLVRILNVTFSIIVVTIWFTIIFKVLPEARVNWDVAFSGGLLTAILYNFGKFILGKVLIHARIASIFGASASLAILLLFIFYCSFILYYGAAFTHEYGDTMNQCIRAGKYSNRYEEKLIENAD